MGQTPPARWWWRPPVTAGFLVLALVVGAACSGQSQDPPTASETSTTAVSPDGTGSTQTTAPAVAGAPPREVVFTGDSVMQQLAAAMIDALDGPTVHATYAGTIAIAGQEATVVGWQTVLAVDVPDTVVVMVGTWEREGVRNASAQGGWPEPYHLAVAPFLDTLTTAGVEVIWLTYPPAGDDGSADITLLNEAVGALPQRFPGVEVIDAGAEVAGPSGRWTRTLTDQDGTERVVREPGVHLCPDGVVLVAEPVLADLTSRLGATVDPGWREGPWREDPALFTDLPSCAP